MVSNSQILLKPIEAYGFSNYEQMLNLGWNTLDKSGKQAYDRNMLALTLNEC